MTIIIIKIAENKNTGDSTVSKFEKNKLHFDKYLFTPLTPIIKNEKVRSSEYLSRKKND